jgi:putative ABC transport system permease protein
MLWVWPTEPVLRANGATRSQQMLYRFDSADDEAALRTSLTTATAGLPAGALLSEATYLAAKLQADTVTGAIVPFVVAFAVLGLIAAVLIISNMVNGAVVAGFRTIGMLKSIGFTPGQVVAVYVGQALVAATVGAAAGVPLGNAVAIPVLRQAQRAYDVSATAAVPAWVSTATPLCLLAIVGTRAMIVSAMAAVGVIAGKLAVPLGWALHRAVLPAMGDSFGTRLPPVVRDVNHPGQLIGPVAAGAAIAVLGSLIPAGWAARTHPAAALRAE